MRKKPQHSKRQFLLLENKKQRIYYFKAERAVADDTPKTDQELSSNKFRRVSFIPEGLSYLFQAPKPSTYIREAKSRAQQGELEPEENK